MLTRLFCHQPTSQPWPTVSGLLLAAALVSPIVHAQTASLPQQQPATPAQTAPSKPAWKELSPTQQQALKPLAAQWETLSADRKRKWLALSQNYASLSPEEQVKLHARMAGWAALSPQQRAQARINFTETQKQLTTEERAAQWRAYQDLSPEEKRALATKAPPKPTGAAILKPTPTQRLTPVPVTRNAPKAAPAPSAPAAPAIDPRTLLPQPPAPVAAPAEADAAADQTPLATPDSDTD